MLELGQHDVNIDIMLSMLPVNLHNLYSDEILSYTAIYAW